MKTSRAILASWFVFSACTLFSSASTPSSITVTSPNGGEVWLWNTSQTITWTSTGSIANVKIEYSLDNGSSWATAVASYANSGSMSMAVPYMPSTQALVRVSDASDSSVYGVSAATFYLTSDGTEPNNSSAQAAVLTLGTTTANLVFDGGSVGDVDWYKVFVPASEAGKILKVNVKITSPYPSPIPAGWASDIDFDLYDGSLRHLASTFSGSDNETLYLPAVSSGWYYIHVGSATTVYADSSQYARYSVDIETAASFGLGTVTGKIVNGSGQGIPNVDVRLYYDWGVSFPTVYTDASGNFAIANLPGQYALYFAGNNGTGTYVYQLDANVVAEYYNHKASQNDLDVVALAADQTLSLGAYPIAVGAIVTGRLTNANGGPLSNGPVTSYDAAGNSSSYVYTDNNGNYTLAGVPVGSARLRFRHNGWADSYYNNHPSLGPADALTTQSGVTIPNINAQLPKGGIISGTVKDTSGNPLPNISVQLFSVSDSTFFRTSLTTASNGTYNFFNVMAGDYKVYFNSGPSGYVALWYNNAASFAAAATVHVNDSQTTSGIDAQLTAGTAGIKFLQGATEIPSGGTIDFGTHVLNTTTDIGIAIQNTGNVTLKINGSIIGTNADQFSYSGNMPPGGINPGVSVPATLHFLPTTTGGKTAQVSITNNVPGKSPYIVNLTGTGVVPTTITMTSPVGGESWNVGSSHAITWTWAGILANVKIEYSTNGGASYSTVVDSTANTGSYTWAVPNTPSTNCLVRVSDVSNVTTNAVSPAAFTIVFPSITISGTVTLGSAGVANVAMAGFPTAVTTDASGRYVGTVDYGWSGTVTPTLAGYTFTPASTTYTTIKASQTTNYAAVPMVLTVNFIGTTGGTISGNTTQKVNYGGDTTAVTAVASAGYQFTGWWGDYTSTANPLVIHAVHGNMTIHVAFSTLPPTVKITSPAAGAQVSGTVDIQTSVTYAGSVTKVEAYIDGVKIGNLTASTTSGLAVDLNGGIAAYLCLDGKLRKVMADGTSRPVLTPDVGVDYFQANSLGGYIAFQKPQIAADGNSYRLMRIDLAGQQLVGIDDDFAALAHDALASRAIQADDQGYAYYFIRNVAGETALRRWKAGDSPSTLWVDRMNVLAWSATRDGQVVVAGDVPDTGERWLKRWAEASGVTPAGDIGIPPSPGRCILSLFTPDTSLRPDSALKALALRDMNEPQKIEIFEDKLLFSDATEIRIVDPSENRTLSDISLPEQVVEACPLEDGSVLFSRFDAAAGAFELGLAENASVSPGEGRWTYRSLATPEGIPKGLEPLPLFESSSASIPAKPEAAPDSQGIYHLSWNTWNYSALSVHYINVNVTVDTGLVYEDTIGVRVFNFTLYMDSNRLTSVSFVNDPYIGSAVSFYNQLFFYIGNPGNIPVLGYYIQLKLDSSAGLTVMGWGGPAGWFPPVQAGTYAWTSGVRQLKLARPSGAFTYYADFYATGFNFSPAPATVLSNWCKIITIY